MVSELGGYIIYRAMECVTMTKFYGGKDPFDKETKNEEEKGRRAMETSKHS